MAKVTGKRKREDAHDAHVQFKKTATAPRVNGDKNVNQLASERAPDLDTALPQPGHISIQIVTGSYERALHGVCATIPSDLLHRTAEDIQVSFTDNFLFAAHTSSVRCLALSPPTESGNRILATGGSDERVNLYNLSTAAPPTSRLPQSQSSLITPSTTAQNPRNRSLGNLIHHDRAITRLSFPTKSKLFSAAEDNNIAISRTRDWTVLSSIKAPIPKPHGRPSGDTAGPGEVPAGVNDFAIHPSQKLMLSVGRGERCMRLWNLMTGKKAGVLNFDRQLLASVGEGKYSSGEGRRVLWDPKGETFVVGFERGAVLFGIDSKPKAVMKSSPPSKFHQMQFVSESDILAVSTEDGRILFFDTNVAETESVIPSCACVGQLGGRDAGIVGRIKDFEILALQNAGTDTETPLLIATGSSDGTIRMWTIFADELSRTSHSAMLEADSTNGKVNGANVQTKQVGNLIGLLETGNRITCLGAFVMDGTRQDIAEEEEFSSDDDGEDSDSDDSE